MNILRFSVGSEEKRVAVRCVFAIGVVCWANSFTKRCFSRCFWLAFFGLSKKGCEDVLHVCALYQLFIHCNVNVFRFFGSYSFCEDGCEGDVTYACEFCRTKYNSYAEAEACEAHGEGGSGKAKKCLSLISIFYIYTYIYMSYVDYVVLYMYSSTKYVYTLTICKLS